MAPTRLSSSHRPHRRRARAGQTPQAAGGCLFAEAAPAPARVSGAFLGLAVDSAGNLFFADMDNNRIRTISPDGTISTVAGSGPAFPDPGSFAGDGGPATAARLSFPSGVAIDAAGNLLPNDGGNSRIRKVIGIAAPGLVAGQ